MGRSWFVGESWAAWEMFFWTLGGQKFGRGGLGRPGEEVGGWEGELETEQRVGKGRGGGKSGKREKERQDRGKERQDEARRGKERQGEVMESTRKVGIQVKVSRRKISRQQEFMHNAY